jgi:hypothetical protein
MKSFVCLLSLVLLALVHNRLMASCFNGLDPKQTSTIYVTTTTHDRDALPFLPTMATPTRVLESGNKTFHKK